MLNLFERKGLKIFAVLLSFLTKSNVNRACTVLYSLKHFKQIK
ncbi:hypothetical protein [Thomasclavelia cocleata]|nr:hypothetical protein [Thomasclavelia cocleata]